MIHVLSFFQCILYGAIPIIQHFPLDEISSLSELFLMEKLEELRDFYEINTTYDNIHYW
jgi:hypothetical protein